MHEATASRDRRTATSKDVPGQGKRSKQRTDHHLIREAIVRDLTNEERLLVLLRYAEGMTWAEVAEVLGVAADRAEVFHSEIVAKLRLKC